MADELDGARAVVDVQSLAFAAVDFRGAHGRWPSPSELLADAAMPRLDPWAREFRFEATDTWFAAHSAGVDGAWNTCDDVHSHRLSPGMHACPSPDAGQRSGLDPEPEFAIR